MDLLDPPALRLQPDGAPRELGQPVRPGLARPRPPLARHSAGRAPAGARRAPCRAGLCGARPPPPRRRVGTARSRGDRPARLADLVEPPLGLLRPDPRAALVPGAGL